MAKHLARDLERLQRSVLRMAGTVEDAIFTATKALHDRNPDLAAKVVAGDSEIDRFENAVQEECLKILALHQPVAVDLRRVCTVLLITTDLERMGDLAVAIAERSQSLNCTPSPAILERTTRMTTRAMAMVRASLDAFVSLDAAAAQAVIGMDDEVDSDNDAIIRDILDDMKRHPDRIDAGVSLFSAVRHIERIADHATNIAEDVIYLVQGELVRHKPKALDGG